MIKEFLKAVRSAERNNETEAVININAASEAKEFIEVIIEARKKGGRNSKRQPVKMDKKSIQNRERVRRWRESRKTK